MRFWFTIAGKAIFKPSAKHINCALPIYCESLSFFEQRYQSQWAADFKQLLHEALNLKKNLYLNQYNNPISERDKILGTLDALLQKPLPENQKNLRAFHKRMIKYKRLHLYFSISPRSPNRQ